MEQENRMGTDKVSSVLLKKGIPVILSMVLQAMYNIVDSMFVARMPDMPGIEHTGELAVNALTLSFPIQMLIIAFGIGTGVGMGAMLSRQLGSGDKKGASRTAGNGIFLAIVIYLIFLNATDVIWWAFPIGEAVAAVAAVLLLKRIYRLKVEPMKDWK